MKNQSVLGACYIQLFIPPIDLWHSIVNSMFEIFFLPTQIYLQFSSIMSDVIIFTLKCFVEHFCVRCHIIQSCFFFSTENFTSDSMIEIDAFGEWTNLALRWNQRAGLEFYKDGRLVAMDPTGYRKFRIKDDETRLILGRRNDYLGNAANFSWEEAAIVEDFLEPFKMRESLIKLGL